MTERANSMHILWMAVLYIGTAGLVGGVTNHLAIKMLFYPRNPLYLFGKKVPFTPGLIPKRKDEIGGSLGKVVSEYLVTTEGLTHALGKPELRAGIESKLREWLDAACASELTAAEALQRFWPQADGQPNLQAQLAAWLRSRSGDVLERLWNEPAVADKRLGELIPGWNEASRERLVAAAVQSLVAGLTRELHTPQGERLLRKVSTQFLEQSGGFLGTLAGIFMDEDKLVQRVRTAIVGQLSSASVQQAVHRFLSGKIDGFEQKTIREAIEWLARDAGEAAGGEQPGGEQPSLEQPGLAWLRRQLDRLPIEAWLERLGSIKVRSLLAPRNEWLASKIPLAVDWALGKLQERIPVIVKAIDLPKIVEAQVANFPVERIETIILSLSGKEFRAITWLGVLLGGIIGAGQLVIFLLQQ